MAKNQNDQKYPYGYRSSKISIIKLFMNKANVMKWSFYLSISGFLILYLWSLLKENLFSGTSYEFLDGFIVAFAFLIWGCLGLFWAYRRQIPQVVTVKGKSAYIIGIFVMISSWSMAIYSVIIGTQDMIESIMKLP